jgi:hypothetical protein
VLADAWRTVRSGVYEVQQVDATGGGDAFVAGFVFGRLQGRSVDECLKLGSALGASCVQSPGATTGVFRAPELEAFVAGRPLAIARSTLCHAQFSVPLARQCMLRCTPNHLELAKPVPTHSH